MEKRYKIVRYYARSYSQEFNTKAEAEAAIQAHAMTRRTANYAELWEMLNEDDGEMVALFDYGSVPPEKLVWE